MLLYFITNKNSSKQSNDNDMTTNKIKKHLKDLKSINLAFDRGSFGHRGEGFVQTAGYFLSSRDENAPASYDMHRAESLLSDASLT